DRAVLHMHAATRLLNELLARLLVEVAGEILGRGVDLGEGWQFVDHLMVQVIDDGPEERFENLEVKQQAGFIKLRTGKGDEHAIVVPVRVLALAMVVAQEMARREPCFYCDFKHMSGIPSLLPTEPFFDCIEAARSL